MENLFWITEPHKTPPQKVYDKMKYIAKMVWTDVAWSENYLKKKIQEVNSVRENCNDNAMLFWRRFDSINKQKFEYYCDAEILEYIKNNK